VRILVAEDDRGLREVLVQGLEDAGYLVDSVDRGDDAIEQLKFYEYDVAILDWRMPGLPGVEVAVTGRGFTIEGLRDPRIPMQAHQDAAASGWALARQAIAEGKYDVVVLDEILGAVNANLVPIEEVLDTVRSRPRHLHLVLTGRGAPPELIAVADLVSEVRPIKHPYEQGIPAQRGIEF